MSLESVTKRDREIERQRKKKTPVQWILSSLACSVTFLLLEGRQNARSSLLPIKQFKTKKLLRATLVIYTHGIAPHYFVLNHTKPKRNNCLNTFIDKQRAGKRKGLEQQQADKQPAGDPPFQHCIQVYLIRSHRSGFTRLHSFAAFPLIHHRVKI